MKTISHLGLTGIVASLLGCGQQMAGSELKADIWAFAYNVQSPWTETNAIRTDPSERARATSESIRGVVGASPGFAVMAQETYPEFSTAMSSFAQGVKVPPGSGYGVRTEIFLDKDARVQDNAFVPFSQQEDGLMGAIRTAGIHTVEAVEPEAKGGRQRFFISAHFPYEADARATAERELVAHAAALKEKHPGADIVVGADANGDTGSLRSQFQTIGGRTVADSATPTWDNANNVRAEKSVYPGETGRIDDVFVVPANPATQITGGVKQINGASDHYPVVAHIPDLVSQGSGEQSPTQSTSTLPPLPAPAESVDTASTNSVDQAGL